jgi:hypothetical protein
MRLGGGGLGRRLPYRAFEESAMRRGFHIAPVRRRFGEEASI